jgi:thiamine-phosphate pyrophosphorylase
MNREKRLKLLNNIDLYPVTCQELSNGRTNLEVLDAVLAGGAKIVQLREKDRTKKALYDLAVAFKQRTQTLDALLIINDHIDIALAVDADGVHLGQNDLPIHAARKIAPDLIIGASSHDLNQAIQAEKNGADYINIGPVFPTKTKKTSLNFVGVEAITHIGPKLNKPFTVMGGINQTNIHEVLKAGARRVAMVTGITLADNITTHVQALRKIILSYK